MRLAFVVSGGYLSFRALRTWSLRVAAGAAAFSSLCLSSSGSLHPALQALTVAVSQAKAFNALSEARPGKIHNHQRPKKNTMLLHGVFLWYPAATYLSGPSPAKYCRRIRA